MNNGNLKKFLVYLSISAPELAVFFDINKSTVQRWISGVIEIPKSTERVLETWAFLKYLGFPWHSDSNYFLTLNHLHGQIRLQKTNAIKIVKVTKKVYKLGEVLVPWSVSLFAKKATLEKMLMNFCIIPNGRFLPQPMVVPINKLMISVIKN